MFVRDNWQMLPLTWPKYTVSIKIHLWTVAGTFWGSGAERGVSHVELLAVLIEAIYYIGMLLL